MIRSLEEADIAIKALLQDLTIDGKPVKVVFINPQAPVTPKEFPCFTIAQSGDYQDLYREENQEITLGESIVGGKRIQEKTRPEPISLYYIIRLYATSHGHQTKMKDKIRHTLKRGACITLGGKPYPLTQISYRNPTGSYSDFGEQKANEQRLFIDQYLVKIQTFMIHNTTTERVVEHTKVRIKVKE